jgi:4a-hydroxytetrahydrobiopterin dehydratase
VRAGTWRRRGLSLVRELSFRDFEEALGFVQRVADGAVDHERRPDLCIYDFNRVRITIANLHRGALTQAEMRLAAKVDDVVARDSAR